TVDPFAFADLPDQVRQIADASPPARAAIEMALLDWVGQKLNVPLYRLFGLNAGRTPATSFTIGLDTPEVMQQKTREAGPYHIIKVKLGRPNDREIIKALRAVTDKPIRVDANEGWPDKETNIKLMKAGGVLEALRMFQVAKAFNLDTMLGCMIETSIAITAAVQLQSLARWVDLDGNLLLSHDPFAGAVMKAGRWQPPDRPGLGVKPRVSNRR